MQILTDAVYAWRTLRREPAHSAFVVLILALGIAAAVSVYSIVSGVLLRPLPFAESDGLVFIRQVDPERAYAFGASGPSVRDWHEQSRTLELVAAYSGPGGSIVRGSGEPIRLRQTSVTGEFFGLLGVRPVAGRLLHPADTEPGAARVVVLAHAAWSRLYGGDRNVIGRVLTIGEEPHEIVGVAPPALEFPDQTELWTPIAETAAYMQIRDAHILGVVGRLRPELSPEHAERELIDILAAVPGYGFGARVTPLEQELVGDVRTPLLILLGAVMFVLLIACANVGNLLLARAVRRRHEFAVRGALGASWQRLAAQLFAESMLLSLLAGAAGVLGSVWLVDVLIRYAPQDLPRAAEISVDLSVLGFAMAVSLATGVLIGVSPVLRAVWLALDAELRVADPRAGGGARQRTRSAFVIAEVALSVVLLFAAGLLTKSFLTITSIETGFDPERLTTFEYSLPDYRYSGDPAFLEYQRELLEQISASPLVSAAALSQNLPIAGRSMITPALVEGREFENPVRVQISAVSPDYFRTMGIPLIAGRAFDSTDREDAPPVAIVNQAFINAYFTGEDAIGRYARTYFGPEVMRQIVGVAGDTKHVTRTESPQPMFYYPVAQLPPSAGRLVVRSGAPAPVVIAAVRAVARRVDAEVPLGEIATMSELLARTTARPQFYAVTLATFAALALLLAITGFYAVLSQAVAGRQRELGVRMALGARSGQILRLVIGEALRLIAIGLALGGVGALVAARLLRGLLFGVQPSDPAVLAVTGGLLLALALLASWLPARRAVGTDPVQTLRAQ